MTEHLWLFELDTPGKPSMFWNGDEWTDDALSAVRFPDFEAARRFHNERFTGDAAVKIRGHTFGCRATPSAIEPIGKVVGASGDGFPRVEWYGSYPKKGTPLYAAPRTERVAPEHQGDAEDSITRRLREQREEVANVVMGWREVDWPEGFDRRTAELVAQWAAGAVRSLDGPRASRRAEGVAPK